MPLAEIQRWIARHRWLVVLILVMLAGYTVGKDLALRDNARDAVASRTGSSR